MAMAKITSFREVLTRKHLRLNNALHRIIANTRLAEINPPWRESVLHRGFIKLNQMEARLKFNTTETESIVDLINTLRSNSGASVIICCPNEDYNDHDNEAIEVCDEWTDWKERRFEGSTLFDALTKAYQARTKEGKHHEARA